MPENASPPRSTPNPKLYSHRNLQRYHRLVVGLSHRFAWKVDNTAITALYARHLAASHLEVGPADGHFLVNAPDPVGPDGMPLSRSLRQIHLLDLHAAPLERCARLLDERAQVSTHQHDVLARPWPLTGEAVGSVAMFHVLHCIEGASMFAKHTPFSEVARVLAPGGVFIGSTLLGVEDPFTRNNWLARRLQRIYNRAEPTVFNNHGDRFVELRHMLSLHFTDVQVSVMGAAGVWVAKGPRR